MTELMRQFIQACAQQATPPGIVQAEERALDRFLRFNPSKFYGESDDLKTKAWIAEMEQIFEVTHLEDPKRVELAVFLLRGPAQDWWKFIRHGWRVTGGLITWERFTIEFRNK